MGFKLLFAFSACGVICIRASAILNTRQTSLPAGWTSIGCYSDSTSSRTLSIASFTDVNTMTIESCIAFCTPAGYKYAGVEFARECYCDNVIEAPAVIETDGGCNMACTGNSAEICGGANRINIFQNLAVGTTPTPTPVTTTTIATTATPTTTVAATPTPTIKQTAGTFQYKGCFQDVVLTTFRTLANQVTVSGVFNAEGCTAACKAAGFPLAGLEFGQECWCDTYMEIVTVTPDSDCNKPCVGDATETCGAGNRLAVYQDTSATPPSPQVCLKNLQLALVTLGMQAVPSSGGTPLSLTGIPFSGSTSTLSTVQQLLILTQSNTGPLNQYLIGDDSLDDSQDELNAEFSSINDVLAAALAPVIGGAQLFITDVVGAINVEAYNQFCAKPNPVGLFGPFIGPAVLSVNNHSDQWALCPNVTAGGRNDVVYSPIATNPDYVLSQCQSIVIQLPVIGR